LSPIACHKHALGLTRLEPERRIFDRRLGGLAGLTLRPESFVYWASAGPVLAFLSDYGIEVLNPEVDPRRRGLL
jgi:hypothetical protein